MQKPLGSAMSGKTAFALRTLAIGIVLFVLTGFHNWYAAGVITQLDFSEGSGTVTADVSGNNHPGTLVNGPTWIAGKYGQGISFDGSNDYINIADHADYTLTPSQSYTWSAWVRNNNFNQWSTIWSQTASSTSFFYFYAHSSNDAEAGPVTNGISVYWYSGSNKLVMHSNNNVLSTGTWSYVTVTYNASAAQASRFTIYVNGVDVSNRSDVVSSGTIATIDPTAIRVASNLPFGEYLNGAVDEVKYYRRLLAVSEIQSDMNSASGGQVPDQVAPTVSLTAPAAGTVSGTVNVTATASDNTGVAGVQFLLDGVALGAEDVSSPYAVSWTTTSASNGTHTLAARARDAAGNTTTSSPVTVTVSNADTQAPVVTLASPGSTVSGTITLNATASDNISVAGVQFLLDGVNLGSEDIASPYSVSWSTTSTSNGTHTLTARARDAAGNTTTSAPVTVTVNNDVQAPAVTVTQPASPVSGTITINATASDNVGVAGVQFFLDGVNLGAEDVSSPYSVSWATNTTTNGTHTLTARARDAAGNTSTSAPVTVTVNNDVQAPAVSVTQPAGSPLAGIVTLEATASDDVGVAGVQFRVDGVNTGAEDLTAPYSLSWSTTSVSNGTHSITAIARDAAGNSTTSQPVTVTVFNNGLVAAFGFNENTGTIANDNSGNGNTGTLTNGPVWSPNGKYGAAIQFDGTNDLVNISDANILDLSSGMTLEAWVNPSNLSGYKTILCKENGTTNLAYALAANNATSGTSNQRPDARFRTSNATRTVTGPTKLTTNAWTHIAATYDGTNFRLFINGTQAATLSTSGSITATTNALRIGGSSALAQYFTGLIDEVRIYNRALTAAEIQSDMNTPIAPDTQAPSVTITAPAAGNVAATINISATATDNIAVTGVQFLLDGNPLGAEDLASPFSVSWNTGSVTNGDHTLSARARDAAGNTATSAIVNITVNNDVTPPGITITSVLGDTISGTVTLTADATDDVAVAGVQFLLNGTAIGAEDVVAPYSYSWNSLSVNDGNYTITARARDAAGNTTVSGAVNVTVFNHPPDTEAPSVAITSPLPGEVTGTVTISASAADNVGVVSVQFYVNGIAQGSADLSAPYSINWNTIGQANGDYTLTVKAIDAAGNATFSDPVLVTVNNYIDDVSPAVTVTGPLNTVSGTVAVSATASDNVGVTAVQFYLDDVVLGAMDSTAPYNISWNTTSVSNGTHAITARAFDAAGNSTLSEVVTVTVANTIDNTAPVVSISSPTGGSVSGTVAVSANASDNVGVTGVQFLLDGNILGTEDLSAPYSISWNSVAVVNGTHNLAARARDAAGNTTTSAPMTITVANATNLIAALHVNEGTGTTAADISGKNHPGTLTNSTWTAGKFDQAVNFNGTSSYLSIADHNDFTLDPTQSYSWSAWVRNANFNQWGTVWSQTIDANNYFYFYAHTSADAEAGPVTNGVSVYWYNGSNRLVLHSNNNVLTANTWSHIAITYNGSLAQSNRFTIYVNGVDVTNRTDVVSTGTIATLNPVNIRLGANQPYGDYLNAALDDIRFYNKLQTITEILYDMTNPLGNDVTPPVVSISSPAANSTVSGNVNVTATATDNIAVTGVQFLLDGVNLGTEDVTAPYTLSWNSASVANGAHTIAAKARDGAGNTTQSTIVTFNVNNYIDTVAPLVAITSPAAGDVSGIVTVTATATDSIGVTGVQFYLDNLLLGEDLSAPYSISWNSTQLNNGNYSLKAIARDAAGNSTTSEIVPLIINNIIDTEAPVVALTAPQAGNVSGMITISATASDNVGVAGVQFLLDGNNLGTEDVSAPYTINWNSGMVQNGTHTLSARAKDASGNSSVSAQVVITVANSNPPQVTGVGAGSLTYSSAVISWTTNVPAGSKVNYGTTTSYGLNTLTDSTLVTAHSMLLQGLAPSTLYHYQVVSADANGLTTFSGDATFTTPAMGTALGTLNGHSVFSDGTGKIIPWTPNPSDGFHTVIGLSWNYLLNTVPNDPSTGKPAYYSRSLLDPSSTAMVNWPHNPAGLYAMLIESAQKYYQYSGNVAVMTLAENVALWHLDHGMTLATDNWPSVPYASGDAGTVNYNGADFGNSGGQGDGDGYIQPDKIGELGNGWLELYKYDGNLRFRDAAIQCANVLSSKIRTGTVSQSPWPFRVSARTGAVREDYSSHIIAPITLFDNLIAAGLGDTAAYRNARTIAWNWMMTYPMVNNAWAQYFEDVPIQQAYNTNLNQYNAMMAARYILEHPEYDANWETHVRGLISWTESVFGQASYGATAIKEQTPVFAYVMGSHTSRYGSINALLYEKTGDAVAKEKAFRALNWATYMARSNGVVIDGPEVNTQWFTDGYGDYVRHFITGMSAVPEWSPASQTHILRSTSIVKNVSYGTSTVNYTTFDTRSTEVIHVNFDPVAVMVDGQLLARRSDLGQPGWTLDVNSRTLRIFHNGGTQVSISGAAAQALIP